MGTLFFDRIFSNNIGWAKNSKYLEYIPTKYEVPVSNPVARRDVHRQYQR